MFLMKNDAEIAGGCRENKAWEVNRYGLVVYFWSIAARYPAIWIGFWKRWGAGNYWTTSNCQAPL